MTARCASTPCGRFVKADETWCAKHKTGAAFDILRAAAEGAKRDGAAAYHEVLRRQTTDPDILAAVARDEALPHHADMAGDVQAHYEQGLAYIERFYPGELEAAVKGGTSGPHETTLVYPDAANDLARGKHRPVRVRWYHRLGRKGNDGLTNGERKVMASNYQRGHQRKDI